MTSSYRLVPLADLNLRAKVNTAGNIIGFVDINGRAVSLSNVAPDNTARPAITGDAIADETLTCSTGTWAGEDITYTYQWYKDSLAINGATANTLVLTSAMIGTEISCIVTATNSVDVTTETATGAVTVVDIAPVNSVAPAITGDGTTGVAMSVSTGTWTGYDNTYTYQWQLDAVNIALATTNAYTPVVGDVGKAITCVVTATNTGGSDNATSNTVTGQAP